MLLALSDYNDEAKETALVEGFLCARCQCLSSVLTHFFLTVTLRYVLQTQRDRGDEIQSPFRICLHSLSIPKLWAAGRLVGGLSQPPREWGTGHGIPSSQRCVGRSAMWCATPGLWKIGHLLSWCLPSSHWLGKVINWSSHSGPWDGATQREQQNKYLGQPWTADLWTAGGKLISTWSDYISGCLL